MTNRLAYHVVVHALEARAGWTPARRLASAVAHTLNGHLPYTRYLAAGQTSRRQGAGEASVQRLVEDWLATDVNPVIQLMGQLTLPGNTAWALNAYTHSAQVGVRTTIALHNNAASAPQMEIKRQLLATERDPALCRTGVVCVMESLVARSMRNALHHPAPTVRPLSALAHALGLGHSATAQLSQVFEAEGGIPIPLAAQHLGCHTRTLERRLRTEGLTAEAVRQTVRLIAATQQLRLPHSLTDIAHSVGFADLSHMTRAFGAACGMAPSLLRQVAHGGLAPEPR